MKILFLTHFFPYPPRSGGITRTYNLLKNIAKNNEVSLFSFYVYPNEILKSYIDEISKFCRDIWVTPTNPFETKRPSNIKIISRLLFGPPSFVPIYASTRAEKLIKDILLQRKFDLVHIDVLDIANMVALFSSLPVVLNEQNIEALILKQRYQRIKNLKQKMVIYFEWRKLKRFEDRILPKFNHIITVSELDRNYVKKIHPHLPVSVVPNGVDPNFFTQKESSSILGDNNIVFTGLMDWPPNIDAVLYFCQEIFPLIKEKNRNIKFFIVGQRPTKEVLALKTDRSIEVTGYVEDVRPYVTSSQVFVVPLRIGGGTRLKILEAMAMGVPVVSTPTGCEGLNVAHQKNILIADKPKDFAQAVIRVMDDKELCNKITTNSRLLVEQEYDWREISKKLEKVYKKVITEQK